MSDYHYDRNMERVEDARKHVARALLEVHEVISHDDPGIDKAYLEQLEEVYAMLAKAKRILSP